MTQPLKPSRRDFLKVSTSTAVAGALAGNLALSSSLYAGGNEVIKVGLVGCGGRGTGAAAQALAADPNTRLVAMADAFEDHLENSLTTLQNQPIKDQVQVDQEHQFVGIDAYKKLIPEVDVVLLATPPHFRPAHVKAAVEAGKHLFVEKPIAVDAPGCRSVEESCKLAAEKGLAVVSGLCWRYHNGMRETFDRIHNGDIGQITALQCSYNTQGLWHRGRNPEWSDMEWQLRNWLYFTWLSGDHIAEQHIHSIDKLAWAMGDEYPISASGTGGRLTRTDEKWGNVYDHFAIVYEFKNGVKGFGRCRQQNGCAIDVSDHVWGTKGRADIFKHQTFDLNGETTWRFRGTKSNMYQVEHDELFKSIREGKPINNGHYMVRSTMMAILGRMVAYTGQEITWEDAWNSTEDLTPPSYDFGPLPTPPVALPGLGKA